jgi:hypothetical protein
MADPLDHPVWAQASDNRLQEKLPVVLIQKNIFPAVPSRHHVVVRTRILNPQTSGHGPTSTLLGNIFMHTDS